MQEYSMLFLDIDGTVLDTQNRISPNLKQLFKKLNQEEISIVLNSSRSPSGSMETRRETGLRNPCICYGGGLVVGDKEQIIAECGIPVEEALEFYRFVQNLPYDISVNFFVYDVWITDNKADPMVVRESDIMGLGPVECNLESIGSFAESIHKILCIGSHEALEELVRRKEEKFGGMEMLFSKAGYLEITSRKANKGRAVRTVCDYYGISPENTVAVGDEMIDSSMFEACGLGIAMGNSPEKLKLLADMVAPSTDEDGLYEVLKDLPLRQASK